MIAMAAAPTDTTTVTGGEVVPRRRGKSKAPNFKYDGPVSVIRLDFDVSDPVVRRRVGRQWGAVFRLRRAVQREALSPRHTVVSLGAVPVRLRPADAPGGWLEDITRPYRRTRPAARAITTSR